MSAPSSSLIVTNVSQINIWISGNEVAPNNSSTFSAAQIQGVCSDFNFWAAFLSGNCSVQLNSQGAGLPVGDNIVSILLQVAVGNIVPS